MSLITAKREISEEVYLRAKANNDRIAKEDKEIVFTQSDLYGYGVYGDTVIAEDGKYYVTFTTSTTCD